MTIGSFQVPPEMSEDLLGFVEHCDQLEAVFDAAKGCHASSNTRAFSAHVEAEAKLESGSVYPILSVFVGLHQVCEAAEVEPVELLDAITKSLADKGEPWTEEKIGKWNSCKEVTASALSELTEDSPLKLSAKAGFLTYDRPNILHRTRILTDVRPVFDQAAESIKGMVVTHSLSIGYSEASGLREAYYTLDAEDLRTLLEQCERAVRKANVLADALSEMSWRTMIIPESDT